MENSIALNSDGVLTRCVTLRPLCAPRSDSSQDGATSRSPIRRQGFVSVRRYAFCMRLLLVEDNQALREMIADHLREHGFAVDPAGNAKQALAAATVVKFDAVVL